MGTVLENIKWGSKNQDFTLDTWLEEISVTEGADISPNLYPKGWWVVIDTQGVVAAFKEEKEAYSYRIYLINRIING